MRCEGKGGCDGEVGLIVVDLLMRADGEVAIAYKIFN
jgi:hypothetical protein